MRRSPATRLVLLAALLLFSRAYGQETPAPHREAMLTLTGTVLELGEARGEGEVPLVSLRVATSRVDSGEVVVLLAPAGALAEIGLEVEAGDRVRARIFEPVDGEALAQKFMNLSRDTMVRIRSLHRVPFWSEAGRWQGSGSRPFRGGKDGSEPARKSSTHGPGAGPPVRH